SWRVHEDSITYRLLVVLQPPPGHSFCLERDTTGQVAARPSSIRVLEECMCWKDKPLGRHLCSLHPVDDQQSGDSSSLLPTICSGSYLDAEKTACWVQQLVPAAWKYLPQSRSIQLKVLPSSRSCRFQLTTPSSMNIYMEMKLAVQQ
ncbi:IPIL1 protein, partial [Geococcyx californianus]|nr:IPIL1 protein [Geococcyx californianus]